MVNTRKRIKRQPDTTSPDIAHAEERAAQVWNVSEVRTGVLRLMGAGDRFDMITLNRATFDSWIQVEYRSIDLGVYEGIPRLIPRSRLDTYIRNIDTLDITGFFPALAHLMDCFSFFEIIPALRELTWSTGSLTRTSSPNADSPRFLCVIKVIQNRHSQHRKQAARHLPARHGFLRFDTIYHYEVTVRDDKTCCAKAEPPLIDMLTVPPPNRTTTPTLRRLTIRSARSVDEVIQLLGWDHIRDLRSLDVLLHTGSTKELVELFAAIPPSCKRLTVRPAFDGGAFVDLKNLLRVAHQLVLPGLKRLTILVQVSPIREETPIEVSSIRFGRPVRFDLPVTERLLGWTNITDSLYTINESDPGRLSSLVIELLDYDDGQPLPPMSAIAERLSILGGPSCQYTLKTGQIASIAREDSPPQDERKLNARLTRQEKQRQEIAMIQERKRMTEGQGWSKREKRE